MRVITFDIETANIVTIVKIPAPNKSHSGLMRRMPNRDQGSPLCQMTTSAQLAQNMSKSDQYAP